MTTEQLHRLSDTAAHYAQTPRTFRDWVRRSIVPCYHPTKRTLLFKWSECDAALARFKTGGRR